MFSDDHMTDLDDAIFAYNYRIQHARATLQHLVRVLHTTVSGENRTV